ncbi:MAG: T9SS type A sorting domain-containing protein [Bacteroidales bacterium]|nr:T9SS type A sorting domain-containing protein [Bacteroidales bacterium]
MKKLYILLIILSIITLSVQAQKVILVPDKEIDVPTENPWGLTYKDGWFWASDVENGNIVKFHPYADFVLTLKAPRKHITGLTFEGDYLWVVSDEWDTIAFPWFCSQKALLFKMNAETGEVLDTLLVPYYFWTGPKDSLIYIDSLIYYNEDGIVHSSYRYLMGLSYHDGSLFVSYNGGWGPCLYRVEISNNHITEMCCPHPSGMESVKEELWAIRDHPWEVVYPWGTRDDNGNVSAGSDPDQDGDSTIIWPVDPVMRYSILPLIIKDSMAYEDWDRQLEFDLYASDLTWDGSNFWLLDPWEKKIKRMVTDTIYPPHYCSEILKLEIIPQNPTFTDEVKVVCHSMFTSGGCAMTNYTVDFDDTGDPSNGAIGGIHVNAYHEIGMLTYMCESVDTIPVGRLNAGYHFLDYTINVTNENCVPMNHYIDFFVQDTTKYPVYLEIIPEQPVAGEEVMVVTHGICWMNTWIDIPAHHITLYAYFNSCSMSPYGCGIDTFSLGFLSEETYTLEYWVMDLCLPFPADSLVYYDYMEFDVKGATSIEEVVEGEFNVYPNPANEQLFIDANLLSQNLDVEIYSVTGQLVLRESFHNTSAISLDVSGLKKGIYVLKLNTEKETYNTRIIVQ